ncbi:hypothetical protein TIFTF001_014668 [Ficus carica]|uniref:Uncharacterized protein n=1 Tax=Ficus carica TaxID=3494 RepID=A0AA88A480_FICCA|nr:hypothetical protein TIFTF001_014668 [Ficus carica]
MQILQQEGGVDGENPSESFSVQLLKETVVIASDTTVVFFELSDDVAELGLAPEAPLDPLGRCELVPLHLGELRSEAVVRPEGHHLGSVGFGFGRHQGFGYVEDADDNAFIVIFLIESLF